MQTLKHVQLPTLRPIGGDSLVPWERLWCPFGGQISMEGIGFTESKRGFLAQPSKYANSHCRPLSQWIQSHQGCWVLCGAPGSGKSGAILQFIEAVQCAEPETAILAWTATAVLSDGGKDLISENRVWKEAIRAGRKILVVIDAFDQKRVNGLIPFGALAARLATYETLEDVRLLLACRAADWDPANGQCLIDLWPKTKEPTVLEICPLTRADVIAACKVCHITDVTAFIREVITKRLEAIAHWPLTLSSLLHEFSTTGQLPDAVGDLISKAIDNLLQEPAGKRIIAQSLPLPQMRQLARRAAAVTIFGGFQGLARADAAPEMLTADELISAPVLHTEKSDGGELFPLTLSGVDQVAATALFTPIRPPSDTDSAPPLGFTHQNYAEYLTAEYCRRLSLRQLHSLFLVPGLDGESIPGFLIEVAAWLASMRPDWLLHLIKHVPDIVLRADGNVLQETQKHDLMQSLLLRVTHFDVGVFLEIKRLTPAFQYPKLAEALRPVILHSNAPFFARRLALQIAEQCRLDDLEECLWEVLKRGDDKQPRPWCIRALYDILSGRELSPKQIDCLTAALDGDFGPDEDDDLKGVALLLLVPRVMPVRQVTKWLTMRKNTSLFGTYQAFLERILPGHITETDVPSLLSLGSTWPSVLDGEYGYSCLGRALLQVFAQSRSPTDQAKESFIAWVSGCARHGTVLPLSEGKGDNTKVIEEPQRLAWLQLVINGTVGSLPPIYAILRALHLDRPPLDWSLMQLMRCDASKRAAWAEICSWPAAIPQWREQHLQLLLQCYERFPQLREALRPCRPGLSIHESYIADREQWEEKERQLSTKVEAKKPTSREKWISRCLTGAAQGHTAVWTSLWKALAMEADGSYSRYHDAPIHEWSGWLALSPQQQDQAKGCARTFLIVHDDRYGTSDQWTPTTYSEAGTFAVELLAPSFCNDLQLAEAVRQKWVLSWGREISSEADRMKELAASLYQLNSDALIRAVHEKFLSQNAADQYCQKVRLLDRCWNGSLTQQLVLWLSSKDMKPNTFRTGFEFLASKDGVAAAQLANLWLDRVDGADSGFSDTMDHTIRFCALVLSHGACFVRVLRSITSDEMADRVFTAGADTLGYGGETLHPPLLALNRSQVGQLYMIMARLYRGRRDPNDLEDCSVTYSDILNEATNLMEARHASMASTEEFQETLSKLPESRQRSLAFARSRQVRHNSEGAWKRLPPHQLLRLIRRQDACFIRTPDDLLDFVVDRLQAFQSQPWDVGVQPLWNEPYQGEPSPKHEEVLSNALKRWLDESREFVVNREVQPVEIMPHRLDLKIDIPGPTPTTVIVEVKKAENRDALLSMQTQLVDDYLAKGRHTHGVFLLAWYGHGKNVIGGDSLEAITGRVGEIRSQLALPDASRVETVVLDCRYKQKPV